MKISTNKFVSVSYDLNVGENDERELMERATEEHPLLFIFGTETMLPAFEDKLKGLSAGDSFLFSLQPEEAYGEYYEENVLELPRDIFEVEGRFDNEFVKEGAVVPMMDSDGHRQNGSVLEVNDDMVLVDFNHPLAGETLHFEGRVLDVREATAEEIAGLAASMEDGCSCGCGDCGESAHGDGCGCECN
jgi:FKBP-type peptidyl-prolyl cis-trans isomerase SlyD